MDNVIKLNAFSEVLEILKYIPTSDYEKIPLEIIEIMEDNSDKNSIVQYNPQKPLCEQNISSEAKTIIATLFRDYWATEKQKEKILAKEKYDNNLEEIEKQKEFSIDIFQNKSKENIQTNMEEKNKQLIVIEKNSIFKTIISKIRKFLKKN